MDFQTILKDEATYPDSAEITLGNEKVSLGQIRDLSRKQQKAISEQMDTLTRERNEVKTLAETTADLMTKLQAREAEAPKTVVPEANDFDNDDWWKPVRAKLTPLEASIKSLVDGQKALQNSMEKAALIFANDRWKGQFDRVKDRLKAPKYSDWNFEKVRDYAATNKYLDEYGFPALDKAVEAITREDEMERIKQEAFEKGVREGSVKARLGANPRPTSASGGKPRATSALDPSKNFEDLGDAVADDRELAEMVAGLQGVSPEDLLQ